MSLKIRKKDMEKIAHTIDSVWVNFFNKTQCLNDATKKTIKHYKNNLPDDDFTKDFIKLVITPRCKNMEGLIKNSRVYKGAAQ